MSWDDLLAARARIDVGGGLKEILALANADDVISFAGGFPDPSTFPGSDLVGILEELVKDNDASAFQYGPTQGLASTREYLASRLEAKESRRPDSGELMVTSGAVETLELIGKRYLDPGDLVIVEAPTYLGAIMAFRSFQAEVVTVDLDEDGLRTTLLEQLLTEGKTPKFLYTVPDHQNPAGVTLTEQRRNEVVALARKYGFLVIEDVAYREFDFDDAPRTSLWTLAPDVVVQAGTFSKTFFPGVRLGWAVGPADVIDELVTAKQNTDQCAGALGQRLMEEYGRRGLLDQGLEASRDFYRRRRDRLLESLGQHFPDTVTWTTPRGGFFLWVTGDFDSVTLARRARERGVTFVPGMPFFPDGRGHNNLRMSFSRVEEDEIDEGCRRLGQLLRANGN